MRPNILSTDLMTPRTRQAIRLMLDEIHEREIEIADLKAALNRARVASPQEMAIAVALGEFGKSVRAMANKSEEP